jgi:hypothetical protein
MVTDRGMETSFKASSFARLGILTPLALRVFLAPLPVQKAL